MSQELVNGLVSQIEKQLHGPKREQVLSTLEQNPTADTMAEIVHTIIMDIDTKAADRKTPLDLDVLMGLATETIDMLIEILEAMGVQINADEMREETLLKIVLLHMKSVEGDPEAMAGAQELVEAMTADGSMEDSMKHIAGKEGVNPEQMQATGTAMAGPQQKPLAAGVQQGLMQ